MTLLREVVESFIRLVKAEVASNAVLVPPDDVFEITKVPSFILQGPTPSEDGARRCPAPLLADDRATMTFTETAHPRLYHLDFDLVATAGDAASVLDMQEKTTRFFQTHLLLPVGDRGELNLTLLIPLGGWRRVNLSNLRQVSGRCRIEDCPVYDDEVREGRLIHTRVFEFRDGVNENAAFGPTR
ncbi:MAG TPA: hypothetical protein PK967_20060 [Candidatus Hydrogenedentes bacterium]|nr:hypothetical protein [Candidatus Hydrogenedentota bacterium]